jgi:hypothetical protein
MPEGVADGTKLGSIDWGSLVSEEPRWVLRLGLLNAMLGVAVGRNE